jgi:hypothetical protein
VASKPTDCLLCSRCGTQTRFVGIERDNPGHDPQTFECPKCQHFDTMDVKAK